MTKVLPRNVRSVDKAVRGTPCEWRIEGTPGLLLDVGAKKASWRLRFRPRPGAEKQTHTIGDARIVELSDAIRKAEELLRGLLLEGKDPRADLRPTGSTFGDAFDDWLERHAKVHKKPRSWAGDEKLYHRHIKARLGCDILRTIDRTRVVEVLDDIAKKATPIQANRTQSVISAVFSWALDEGRTESHPALRIRKRGAEKARELVMTDSELRSFWRALETLDEEHAKVARSVRLLLLLGQRLSEVVEMPRDELRLDGDANWSMPASRTKNGLPHTVPLPATAVAILRGAIADVHENPYVFPARRLEPAALNGNEVSRRCKAVLREVGRGDMRLHDLRHCTATGMAVMGIPDAIVQRVQNQITGRRSTMSGRYNQYEYADEKRRALAMWERRLCAIFEGRPMPAERWTDAAVAAVATATARKPDPTLDAEYGPVFIA